MKIVTVRKFALEALETARDYGVSISNLGNLDVAQVRAAASLISIGMYLKVITRYNPEDNTLTITRED